MTYEFAHPSVIKPAINRQVSFPLSTKHTGSFYVLELGQPMYLNHDSNGEAKCF